jgi:hypothetical protein
MALVRGAIPLPIVRRARTGSPFTRETDPVFGGRRVRLINCVDVLNQFATSMI